MPLRFATAAALIAAARLASADRVAPSPSELPAVRLDASSIVLDGVIDEPVWRRGSFVTGFTSFDPVEGQAPIAQASVWTFYDADALYVAARIELPPGTLRGRLAQREHWTNDDLFEIMLDPYLDHRGGYDFAVTPFGVQIDYTVVDDEFSSAWDGVWDSAATHDDHGFTVEIRIPFRTLRFANAPVQDWGIGFGVFTGSHKQFDKWPAMSNDRGMMYAQLGVLRGLREIQPAHDLDVIPTLGIGYGGADSNGRFVWDRGVLFRTRDPALVDAGLDVRYGLSSAANLNATLNPDFSQVEADTDQLVYNLRFPVLFDEKRPFFLEGVSIFAMPIPMLYTRAIVDPIAGLKLTGRIGGWSYGALSVYDQLPLASLLVETTRPSGFEDTTSRDAVTTVGRAMYEVAPSSHVGVFVADKALIDRGFGATAARDDVVAADASLSCRDVYTAIAQLAGSYLDTAGDHYGGLASSLTARRRDKHLLVELRSDFYSAGFRAETSPITRVGVIPSSATASYQITTDSDAIAYITPALDLSTIHDATTTGLLDYTIKPHVAARLGATTDLSLFYSRGQETFVERFRGIDAVGATVATAPSSIVQGTLDLRVGDQIAYDPAAPFLGRAAQGTATLLVRPTTNTELELHYTKSRLWNPDGTVHTDAELYYARLSTSVTTRLSLRVLAQLDTFGQQLSSSALVAYQVYPGTEGFAGYQEQDRVGDGARPLDRRMFVKLSYRWQL